jgi:hypothetical protein
VSRVTPATAGSGHASVVPSATAEVGDDPTVVMELVTDQPMGCILGGTLVEHPSTIFRRS